MKKLYLTLVMALMVLVAMPASAQYILGEGTFVPKQRPSKRVMPTEQQSPAQSASRAETVAEYMTIGGCGGYYQGVGAGAECTISGAVEFTTDKVVKFKNCQITRVQIGIGTPIKGADRTITIFLTKDLKGEPFYTEDFKVLSGGTFRSFTLTTPYDITGEAFYIGYTMTAAATDAPLGVDGYDMNPDYVSYVAIDGDWRPIYEYGINTNVCIKGRVEGENLPKYDVVADYSYYESFVTPGQAMAIQTMFTNNGAASVSSLDVTYEVGDAAPVTKTFNFSPAIRYEAFGTFTFETTWDKEVIGLPLKITISKVNGNDDLDPSDNSSESLLHFVNGRYDRNVVVEEGTGTWCGYCPRGMVGMEYMREKYDDTFIPIAVHVGDEMQVYEYAAYYPAEGYPTSNINRYYYGVDPNADYLEQYYDDERARQAMGQIDITDVKIEGDKAQITTSTKFVLGSDNAQFNIAYVLIEDGVGPYIQNNYFSGGGAMGGWEKLGQTVEMKFNDVARAIDGYYGVPGTVPTTIVKDQTMTYTYTMDIRNITDINNMTVAVLLLDNSVGDIVNAAKWKYAPAGVNDVEIDGASVDVTATEGAINFAGEFDAAHIYTIDGKLVASTAEASFATAPGLYIVKVEAGADTVVKKVVVK